MKLPKFSGKLKKPKLLVRRVVGASMLPTLRPDQIVMAWWPVAAIQVGDIVVIEQGGLEKIKRVAKLTAGKVYLLGDNLTQSTDSRTFGWVENDTLRGKVFWPRRANVT